jgi:hypothetical protein
MMTNCILAGCQYPADVVTGHGMCRECLVNSVVNVSCAHPDSGVYYGYAEVEDVILGYSKDDRIYSIYKFFVKHMLKMVLIENEMRSKEWHTTNGEKTSTGTESVTQPSTSEPFVVDGVEYVFLT